MLNLLDPLLSPVARLLVARGIAFPAFVDRMKLHYVQAAKDKLRVEGAKQTDSRISAMTGLQRRDVARLKDSPGQAPERFNYLAKLVAEWQTNKNYTNPLPRTGACSFEELARSVHQDVHPRTILDELVASKTVQLGPDADTVRLISSSYQPLAGTEDQIDYLAHNTGDHLSAATDNVTREIPPHFERAAHYTDLTEAQINELAGVFRTQQMELLQSVSQRAADMKRNETGPFRFRAGAYFYDTKDKSK